MINSSINLRNVYRNDSTVRVGSKLIVENNMNMMIDGITVSSSISSLKYTDQDAIGAAYGKNDNGETVTISSGWPSGKPNPFKKLFPLDSIAKPFRPSLPGVNYAVTGSSMSYYFNPKTQTYDTTLPRMYYPGASNTYKYWIAPPNTNIDLTLRYKQTQTTWNNAIINGDIPATQTTIPLGNKSALANKIVVVFEKYHGIPKNCTIKIEKEDGTFTSDITYNLPDDPNSADQDPTYLAWSGTVEFFYNGSTWTTEKPSVYSDPILIKSINVKANITENTLSQPVESPRLAIIEVAAKLVKVIEDDSISSIEINKQTSAGNQDLLPVGFVNSNMLTAVISDYNSSKLNYVDYNRYSSSFASQSGWIDTQIVYFTKNTKLIPFIKTYHADGELWSVDKYDETQQGIFYLDTFSINEFGETTINCLDGSKQLMETLCPDILLEKYSVTAILRILLDMVGFTSYNFNLKPDIVVVDGISSENPDKSVPQIRSWWTVDTNTVWQAIQEICRDIQMNAFFDEDGILQFYSRDYIYSQDLASWTFRYNPVDYLDNGTIKTKLPNIINFNKQQIPSANQVKILWSSPVTSNYLSNATYLWQSGASYLSAGGLRQRLPKPTAKVTSASSSNGVTTFIADNDFIVGQVVSVTGLNPSEYNISNLKITAATNTSFSVSSTINKSFISAGSNLNANVTGAVYNNGYTVYTANNSFSEGDKITVTDIVPSLFNFKTSLPISDVTSTSFKVKRNPRVTYQSGGVAHGQSGGIATVTPESTPLIINNNSVDVYQNLQSIYNFSGYFLIDSEIIEFDAIQYQYTPILADDGTINEENATLQPPKHLITKRVWITSQSDVSKYLSLSKPGFADPSHPVETSYFKPTGIYRIKTRGAFNTTPAFHNATSDNPAKAWKSRKVSWSI